MLFADDTMGVRFGPGEIGVVTLLLGAVAGALVFIFRLLLKAKDEQIAREREDTKDYRAIAVDAAKALAVATDRVQLAPGRQNVPALAPVIPERHSEVTEEQIDTANKATLRAVVTAATLKLGLPPRTIEEPEPVIAPGLTPEPHVVDKVKVMVEGEIMPDVPPNGS